MTIWNQYREPKFVPECKDASYLKVMLNKLKIEVDYGRIDNEWVCKFINEMYAHTKLDYYPWSDKQKAKIEELFDRY
jgi:hypothetical protein